MIVTFKPASVTASSGAPLRIVQLANQNGSSENNPTYRPKTRKLASVFPKPTADHARTTRCIRTGQESCGRFSTSPKTTAAATNAQDRLRPATALRHLAKKA